MRRFESGLEVHALALGRRRHHRRFFCVVVISCCLFVLELLQNRQRLLDLGLQDNLVVDERDEL
jgi:hypothetical protein